MDENTDKIDISRIRIHDKITVAGPIKWLLPVIVTCCIAVLCIGYFIFGDDSGASPTDEIRSNPPLQSPNSKQGLISLSATGYVVAQRSAAVSSKATGRLKELRVEEGDPVKQGDILGVLENEDLQALVRERESSLELLKSNERISLAEFDEASQIKERVETLHKTQGISQAEYDSGIARFRRATAQLEQSRSNIKVGEAQLDKVKVDLSYTFIVAPFDGTVLTKNADVGEIVAPFGSSANARAAIVTIADMNSLQVEADISEANLQKVKVGQVCSIVLDSYPDRPYKGKVIKIVPTVDRAKATVLTKIEFLERDPRIIPEMSAKVFFSENS